MPNDKDVVAEPLIRLRAESASLKADLDKAKAVLKAATTEMERETARALVEGLEKKLSGVGAALSKAEKRAAKEARQIQAHLDRLNATKATASMALLEKAVTKAGGVSKLSADQIGILTKQIERLNAAGAKTPKTLVLPKLPALPAGGLGAGIQTGLQSAAGSLAPGGALGAGLAAIGPAGIAAAAGVGALTVAATAAAGAVKDLAERGSQVAGVEKAFRALADAPDELLEKTQIASKGLVTNFDIMQAANKGLLLGLPITADEMGKLTNTAIVLGEAMNVGPGQALQDLITGLGRGSAAILDNLGITIKAEDAYKKYAASLNKTAEELTAAEKKIAIYRAALEAADESTAKIGAVQEDAGKAITQVSVAWQNLRDEVAKSISQDDTLIQGLKDVASAVSFVAGTIRDNKAALGILADLLFPQRVGKRLKDAQDSLIAGARSAAGLEADVLPDVKQRQGRIFNAPAGPEAGDALQAIKDADFLDQQAARREAREKAARKEAEQAAKEAEEQRKRQALAELESQNRVAELTRGFEQMNEASGFVVSNVEALAGETAAATNYQLDSVTATRQQVFETINALKAEDGRKRVLADVVAEMVRLGQITEEQAASVVGVKEATVDWHQQLQSISALIQSFPGGFGKIGSAIAGVTAGVAGIGSALKDAGGLGGLGKSLSGGGGITGILGGLGAVGQIASAAVGIGSAIVGLFKSDPVKKAQKAAGKALGYEISRELAETLLAEAKRSGQSIEAVAKQYKAKVLAEQAKANRDQLEAGVSAARQGAEELSGLLDKFGPKAQAAGGALVKAVADAMAANGLGVFDPKLSKNEQFGAVQSAVGAAGQITQGLRQAGGIDTDFLANGGTFADALREEAVAAALAEGKTQAEADKAGLAVIAPLLRDQLNASVESGQKLSAQTEALLAEAKANGIEIVADPLLAQLDVQKEIRDELRKQNGSTGTEGDDGSIDSRAGGAPRRFSAAGGLVGFTGSGSPRLDLQLHPNEMIRVTPGVSSASLVGGSSNNGGGGGPAAPISATFAPSIHINGASQSLDQIAAMMTTVLRKEHHEFNAELDRRIQRRGGRP